MKKIVLASLLLIFTFTFGMSYTANLKENQNNHRFNGGFDCKVEVISCPGWGGGTRQVCHQNGNGVSCTCGESTACKGGSTQIR